MRAIYGFLCRVAKPFVWMVAVLAVSVVSAADQSTSADASNPQDVSQQLHELKQQYEQTTREFQKRIADLEAEINKQNGARQAEVPKNDATGKQTEPAQTAGTTPSTDPWPGRRSSIPEQDRRYQLWCAGRDLVVAGGCPDSWRSSGARCVGYIA
jgi:hypothetical protein